MPIKTICLIFIQRNGVVPAAAIRYALHSARQFRASLAIHIGVFPVAKPALGHPLQAGASQMLAMVEAEEMERKQRAEETAATIRAEASAMGTAVSVEIVTATQEPLLTRLARLARVCDLCILPAFPPDDAVSQDFAVHMLFGAGGPILIVPTGWTDFEQIQRVVVAWDGSAAAARAVRDALPLIADARLVEVVSVVGEDGKASAGSASDLVARLAGYCREVAAKVLKASNGGVAETLFQHARSTGADLLVMGGYGHSRLREAILGGVTRDALTRATAPTLLSR